MAPKELTLSINGKDHLVRRHSGKAITLVIHDESGTPFAAVVRRLERGLHRHWLVSCSQRPEGIWYMLGLREADEVALGVGGSYRKSIEMANQIAEMFYPAKALPILAA